MSAFDRLDPEDYALPAELRARLVSPALVVYLEAVRHNLRAMLAHVGSPERWRPHVKTTKLPAVWTGKGACGIGGCCRVGPGGVTTIRRALMD